MTRISVLTYTTRISIVTNTTRISAVTKTAHEISDGKRILLGIGSKAIFLNYRQRVCIYLVHILKLCEALSLMVLICQRKFQYSVTFKWGMIVADCF